jgi:protein-L-isoaspartate(D-aspartate) O-methyltransferase
LLGERMIRGIGMTSQGARDRMVHQLREQGIRDERVLRVMRRTPRHLFVDEALASRAYANTSLPIGQGQTISQPLTVARMTEALLADGIPERVLEVGTGSGYQTAVLAQLVPRVYTVERIRPLSMRARNVVRSLGLHNVRYHLSDGSWGWTQYAPYDAILVTAAAERVPSPLLEQLAEGANLVIPVGGQGQAQRLLKIRRGGGRFDCRALQPVRFVPLVRDGGAP